MISDYSYFISELDLLLMSPIFGGLLALRFPYLICVFLLLLLITSNHSVNSSFNNLTCLNASASFNCTDGEYCIPIAQRCNQERDCLDGSDEMACNTTCVCTKGYRWEQSCVDIDECNYFLSCSQICRNTPGSFDCSCVPGYSLQHQTFCRAAPPLPYLLVAAGDRIVALHPEPGSGLISPRTVFTQSDYKAKLQGVTGLAFHFSEQLVFWSNKDGHTIVRDSLTQSEEHTNTELPFIKDIRISPVALAIDWITGKVYWIDDSTGRIEVAELDGRNRMVIVSSLVRPSSIAVDAEWGYLYWSVSDPIRPRIVRAHMDGSHVMTLHDSSLLQPTALAVDMPTHTVYWADAGTGRLECSEANGLNRRVVTSDRNIVHSPYSISLFEDTLYFSDITTGSVSAVGKNGSSYRQIAIGLASPRELQMVHPAVQLGVSRYNPCLVENGGCSHLCLLSNKSHSCHCPTPLVSVDSSDCTYPTRLLLAVMDSSVRSITLNDQHSIDHQLQLGDVSNISAMDWDDSTQSLYLSEYHTGSIYLHILNTAESRVLLQDPEIRVVALAYDWIHSLLYFIDERNQRIEFISVNNTALRKVVVHGLSRVTSLVADPVRGYLAWIDMEGTTGNLPVIMSAGADGTNKRILVMKDLIRPSNLSLDFVTDYLYWYDAGSMSVERVYFDGTRRERVLSVQSQLSAFAISNGTLFYSIEGTDAVFQASTSVDWNTQVISGLPGISYLSVYYPKSALTYDFVSPCFSTHTGCSHLCLLTNNNNNYLQNGSSPVCVCPNGFELSNSSHCRKHTRLFSLSSQQDIIYYSSLQNQYLVILQKIASNGLLCTALDPSDSSSLFFAESSDVGSVIKKITFQSDSFAVADVSILYSDLLTRVSDMIVEPTTQLLYWTDSGKGAIEVGAVSGERRSVLIGHAIYKPELLVLDSNSSRLYWVEVRGSGSFIGRVYLDGSNRESVVSLPNTRINSLAIATLSLDEDVVQYLLWTDSSSVIFCYEVELEFTYSLDSQSTVQSLTVHGSYLYWFDSVSSRIYSATLIPGNPPRLHDRRTLLNTNIPISDLKMASYHQLTSPLTPCAFTGQCSYLCLPSYKQSRYSCYCPVGILSALDTYCPLLPSRFLLISLHLQILYISLDTAYTLPALLYSEDRLITGAVDAYTPRAGAPLILWSDITSRRSWGIKLMDTATRDVSVLVAGVFTRGLAVDQLTGNLFFTDRHNRSINVCNLKTRAIKRLVQNSISSEGLISKPRSVAVDPIAGYLFWTDWGHGTLERSKLDGSERRVLISHSILTPSGLTIDRSNQQLYWIDYAYKSIQSCDYNGLNRSTIIQNLSQPYSITLDYPDLYFTDWLNNTLNMLSLYRRADPYSISYNAQNIIMDVQYIDSSSVPSDPCGVDNGGCPQICLQLGDGRAVCECSDQSADCVPSISTPSSTPTATNASATNISVYSSSPIYLHLVLFTLSGILVALVAILVLLILLFCKKRRGYKLPNPFSPARSFSQNNPPQESPIRHAFADAIFSLTSNSPSPPILPPSAPDNMEINQQTSADPITVSPRGFSYNPLTQSATYSSPVQHEPADSPHTPYYTPGGEMSQLKSFLISTPKRFVSRSKASYQLFPRLQETSNEQPSSPTVSNYFGFSSLTPSKKSSSVYRSSLF